MSEETSNVFKGTSLGHRLYMAVCQYVTDIEGEELPGWFDLSEGERGAWESQALAELIEVIEPKDLLASTLKVIQSD